MTGRRTSVSSLRWVVAIVFLGGTAALLIVALLGTTLGGDHPTWGPFRGRFVDADTGEPIRGAVAYAIWLRIVPNPLHPTQTFDDVRFAVSNDAGEFEIPARRRPLLPFGVEGPLMSFAVPGYQFVRVRTAKGSRDTMEFRGWHRIPDHERDRTLAGLYTGFIPEGRRQEILANINATRRRMELRPFQTMGGEVR
jgi:hypothetical protein